MASQRGETSATVSAIIAWLESAATPSNLEGMARYGINTSNALGITMPTLFAIAKATGRNHAVAAGLWKSGIHEARILAALVEEPARVTAAQMDRWTRDFDSWDVCDQVCNKLYIRTPHAWNRAFDWADREPEFVRRAGFSLMATLAVHDKSADADTFHACLGLVHRHCTDERNFVRKAVNWTLRQIGKRDPALRADALEAARAILADHPDSRAARWIARDAIRELEKYTRK